MEDDIESTISQSNNTQNYFKFENEKEKFKLQTNKMLDPVSNIEDI